MPGRVVHSPRHLRARLCPAEDLDLGCAVRPASGRSAGLRRYRGGLLRCLLMIGALLLVPPLVQAQNRGFQLSRYEPTPSGSWFFAVEHPYYSYQRPVAAGLTLGYAHNPLRYGESSPDSSALVNERAIIENQLHAYLDVAVTIRDRVLLSAALPLVFLETGQSTFGITPIGTVAVSDPRLGVTVRAYGQPHKDPFSVHASLAVWIPLRAISTSLPEQTSDMGARLRAAAVFSGVHRALLWSGSLGFQLRQEAQLGSGLTPAGSSVGSEVQIGLAAGYYLPDKRLVIGPELLFSTSLLPSQAFRLAYTSLELLGGIQHNIAKLVQVGLAVGIGTLSAPGTPDARVLLRIAYAPLTRDRDQDSIPDDADACPDQKGIRSEVPSNNGCPPIPDRDCDGVPDSDDECPDTPESQRPDPARIGCPASAVAPRPGPQHTILSDEPEPPPAGYSQPQ